MPTYPSAFGSSGRRSNSSSLAARAAPLAAVALALALLLSFSYIRTLRSELQDAHDAAGDSARAMERDQAALEKLRCAQKCEEARGRGEKEGERERDAREEKEKEKERGREMRER